MGASNREKEIESLEKRQKRIHEYGRGVMETLPLRCLMMKYLVIVDLLHASPGLHRRLHRRHRVGTEDLENT